MTWLAKLRNEVADCVILKENYCRISQNETGEAVYAANTIKFKKKAPRVKYRGA